MFRILFTLSTVLFLTDLHGQNTVLRFGFSSGLFSFSGGSIKTVSFINYSELSDYAYTNNPYGPNEEFSYGFLANLKRVSKKNFVFGIEAAIERVRSGIFVNGISHYDGQATTHFNAGGKTLLTFDFINFQPFAGYRVASKKTCFDLTAGIDIAYCLHAKENGHATGANGRTYKTSVDRKTIAIDIRPRLQLSTGYKSFGVYLAYSFGQMNYRSGYVGGTNEAYARFLRFGVTYLLK